jgi:hypothetical protein
VFGTVRATSGTTTRSADVLWVCRFRADLITSIEVYQAAQNEPAHLRRPLPGACQRTHTVRTLIR